MGYLAEPYQAKVPVPFKDSLSTPFPPPPRIAI